MINTVEDSVKQFQAAVTLERVLSRKTLDVIRQLTFVLLVFSMSGAFVLYYVPSLLPTYTQYTNLLTGIGLVSLVIWLDTILAKCYHNSYYFRGIRSIIGLEDEPQKGLTYDAAQALLKNPDDVTTAFLLSPLGQSALLRCNIPLHELQEYLDSPRRDVNADLLFLPLTEVMSLIEVGKYLITHDRSFVTFLEENGVDLDTFLGSLRWVVSTHHADKRRQRWWSRDNLSQKGGLGRELSYGTAHLLHMYSRDIRTSAVFSTLARDKAFAAEKVREIEATLVRDKASNVLLVGEAGVGKMDLVMEVARRIKTGDVTGGLISQHMYVLDTTRLFAAQASKQAFEQTVLAMFDEAVAAGHVTVVIEDISQVVREAASLGVELPSLLDEYLSVPDIHLIATDTPHAYHAYLETNGAFVRRFNEILIDTPDRTASVRVLQNIALQQETKYQLLVTYPALAATVSAADRYVVEGVMPDKAISLFMSVIASARKQNRSVITDDLVYETVSNETGIPAGPVTEQERDLLLNLEDKLQQFVIGQERALHAVARAMRRARAGIQSSDKPVGSFLFMGPTGVGKTETAKALARVFFGGEQALQRLDMSEYSTTEAVTHLVGDSDHTGTLPTMLREHPYCVVLLDEFEKASQAVHDIFLQVLDEGRFTDGRGQQINARNCIFIATSNAGSRLILETVASRDTLEHLNDNIIRHIIAQGIFRPELINRFDGTIIFEPLSKEQQLTVANLVLKDLHERVAEKGYKLSISRDLLELVVEKGYDPEFGARPMQRVIQDIIEESIARQIIAGELETGDTISLTRASVESIMS